MWGLSSRSGAVFPWFWHPGVHLKNRPREPTIKHSHLLPNAQPRDTRPPKPCIRDAPSNPRPARHLPRSVINKRQNAPRSRGTCGFMEGPTTYEYRRPRYQFRVLNRATQPRYGPTFSSWLDPREGGTGLAATGLTEDSVSLSDQRPVASGAGRRPGAPRGETCSPAGRWEARPPQAALQRSLHVQPRPPQALLVPDHRCAFSHKVGKSGAVFSFASDKTRRAVCAARGTTRLPTRSVVLSLGCT